ncbi:hypothetical protein BDN72DRAFT_722094, partial [Pluteus cervinus]
KQLDEEINILAERLITLRNSRNAFALINQLPAEILVEVFLWHQALKIEDDPNLFLGWLLVTHVSQYWRSVAFSAKALWATIPTHHTAYAECASQLSYPHAISFIDTTPH